MKKTILKVLSVLGITALVFAVSPDMAMAQDLSTTLTKVRGQLPGVADLLSTIAYIAGIGFGIKAILKLKEHNESKGQIPLSQPITLFVVAALLLALPTLLSTAKGSIFATGATGSSLTGTEIRSIN